MLERSRACRRSRGCRLQKGRRQHCERQPRREVRALSYLCTLAQESDTRLNLVWPSIRTAIRPASERLSRRDDGPEPAVEVGGGGGVEALTWNASLTAVLSTNKFHVDCVWARSDGVAVGDWSVPFHVLCRLFWSVRSF